MFTYENVGSWDWQPEWATGFRAENVRPTFDVFGLGKVLWWMVSGRPIQTLRLWYFDQDQSVERLFPDARWVRLFNELLAKCVVEKESDCLPDASALLEELDKCLAIIENGADLISDDIKRTCRVCGLGQYGLASDKDKHSREEYFGIKPSGKRSYKIFTCDHCGHVQLFHFPEDETPAAWAE